MKQLLYTCAAALFITTAVSCTRTELGPAENDGTAPGPVTNPVVENLHGAVAITFTAPSDEDLAYIKASYKTKEGVVRESTVSRYANKVTLEGFPDENSYVITLQAVDKSENPSTTVQVTGKPLKPVYRMVYDSLKLAADFGGLNVGFQNPTEANIAIVVLTNDSLGRFLPAYTQYTDLKTGNFAARGYANVERKFGVFVRDRWGNISDTTLLTITPFYEEQLNRTLMKAYSLPTDAVLGFYGTFAGLFDNSLASTSYYHSDGKTGMPQWLTYDMGVTAKLSRLVYFMKPTALFNEHNPRIVEIWGSLAPNPNGSFDDTWTLLTTYTMPKPSGLPLGELSQADLNFANEGATITFPIDAPKVRHIRFKTLKNWGNTSYVNIYEIKMYGDSH